MIDEYDAYSDSEILCLFQHVALSNKLSLILVIFLKFYFIDHFMFKQNQLFRIVYGADMGLCL